MANFSNGHSSNTRPVKNFKKNITWDYMWLHICANLWVKIPTFGGVKKIRQRFSEAEPLDSKPHQMPPGCCTPPKMVPPYSLGTCLPKTPSHFDAPSLLHGVNMDFPKTPVFGQSTRTALESPKIDICQNGPQGALGDVSSCLETKFDKKCQWEVSQIAEKKSPIATV